jgi:hypothetical protein
MVGHTTAGSPGRLPGWDGDAVMLKRDTKLKTHGVFNFDG